MTAALDTSAIPAIPAPSSNRLRYGLCCDHIALVDVDGATCGKKDHGRGARELQKQYVESGREMLFAKIERPPPSPDPVA